VLVGSTEQSYQRGDEERQDPKRDHESEDVAEDREERGLLGGAGVRHPSMRTFPWVARRQHEVCAVGTWRMHKSESFKRLQAYEII